MPPRKTKSASKSKPKPKPEAKPETKKAEFNVVHWMNLGQDDISGLILSTTELCRAEAAQGAYSVIIDPYTPNEPPTPERHGVPNLSWAKGKELAMKDNTVNVFHSSAPPWYDKLKHRIWFEHATIEHSFHSQLFQNDDSYEAAECLASTSEAVLTFDHRAAVFWDSLLGVKTLPIPKWIDIADHPIGGPSKPSVGNPRVLLADSYRGVKCPILPIAAFRAAHTAFPYSVLTMVNVPMAQMQLWKIVFQSAHMPLYAFLVPRTPPMPHALDPWYRSSDIIMSSILTGEPSRTVLEAMSMGCGAVGYSQERPYGTGLKDCFGRDLWCDIATSPNAGSYACALEGVMEQVLEDPGGYRMRNVTRALEFDSSYAAEETLKVYRWTLGTGDFPKMRRWS